MITFFGLLEFKKIKFRNLKKLQLMQKFVVNREQRISYA